MNYLFPYKVKKPEELFSRNFTLSFTNGCFDILHSGHIQSLIFAKNKSDKLVVALNSDSSIKRLKGDTRPILSLEHRINVMSSIEVVDFVISFEEDTPFEVINIIKPDVLVKGSDYSNKDIIGKNLVKSIYMAPFYEGASTSFFLNEYVEKLK